MLPYWLNDALLQQCITAVLVFVLSVTRHLPVHG